MKGTLRNNAVAFLAGTVLILIVASTLLVLYNREVMVRTTKQLELSEETLVRADFILNNLQAIDLGLRAYAITKSENHLNHYKQAIEETSYAFDSLQTLLDLQQHQSKELPVLKSAMNEYIAFCNEVVGRVSSGEDSLAREMIIEDRGYEAWSTYQKFFKSLSDHQERITLQAREEYHTASSGSIWMMIALVVISTPTIFFIVYLLRRAAKKRKDLFIELEQNNRKYNFDPGVPADINNEYNLIEGYIENSKKAANFVNHIASGQYDVSWDGLSDDNRSLNHDNLAGSLVKMRDKMINVKSEEQERQWVTKGLAEFSELIRNHQENVEKLAFEATLFLVKYLKAQQGGLFLVSDDDEGNKSIDLIACYAFNRKKFINKKIQPGEGLIGQAYFEGQTIYLKEIPVGYANITSGLGDATPKTLLIVPMRYNDEVQALIEIASFEDYQPYEIEFLEKVGEFVASAVSAVQTNEVTKKLLVEAQQMAEEMKAQEEEMRQNMEELSATQEEMHRKEKEYISRIEALEAKLVEEEKEVE